MENLIIKCNCCQEDKPFDSFSRRRSSALGYIRTCKSCIKVKRAKLYADDKAKSKETTYKWREANRQYYLDYMRFKRGENPDFVPKPRKVKYTKEEAKERERLRSLEYNKTHKEQYVEWMNENREEQNAKTRERLAKRRKTDLQYITMNRLRDRIKKISKKKNTTRLAEYDELFGCSIEFYRTWIESHFLPGMTWDNWGRGKGKWNLDHHYPCMAFDLTNLEQQKICFHYTNTYPMWFEDNQLKRDAIPSSPRENIYIPDFAKSPTLEK